ncbi:hypothetical protein [Xanthomarina spongicola]|uniref:Lipoprotein n=1 Tax=Xanthomarina spongicola TaxID=570520 RepID=A0A316DR17_9FLAO|nr:hypothetical protein [Xanthomarina spongicola]PWK19892.1 hypothetical protein LX78_01242 [Xanthomarina spongicola]
MRAYIILLMMSLLSSSCTGQKNDLANNNSKAHQERNENQPQGIWRVEKEFDKDGNLIRIDSIYSWSYSSSSKYNELNDIEKDSLLEEFKSRFFKQYSHLKNDGFGNLFNLDSIYSKNYFNDDFFKSDFGNEFMNLDKITQQMIDRQKAFLEKYQPKTIEPIE